MLQSLFTTFTLLFINICAYAQIVRGTVVDNNGYPVPDAYVYSASTEVHSHTDLLGQFKCSGLTAGDTLVVSFLGFKTIKYAITDRDFSSELILTLEEANYQLDQVSISNSLKSVYQVANIDLKINPVRSSQEILRRVPGLFIGQHAGGGKAEQIFLRGFDIDHGTDIAITVDGMPVNMVSHAHGQGYADLHFLIPETIDNIDFAKGPYYAGKGNFNTAGYVDFKTKDRLQNSTVGMDIGQFNTIRTVALLDLISENKDKSAYIASEYLQTDGPVESPQNFNRINLMGKYSTVINSDDRLSLVFSRFQSKWDASGQIPQRLVDTGVITRFGSVDDTEGGTTSRTNIAIDHTKLINDRLFAKTKAYFSRYDFELYSNFTFFLEDPVNGDQIRQKEKRNIYGLESTFYHGIDIGNNEVDLVYGLGLRYDQIDDVELSSTRIRQETLSTIALGDVDESNVYAFVGAEWQLGNWTVNPSLRYDYFNFDYVNALSSIYETQSVDKGRLSPKFNIIYNPNAQWQLFLKSGIGFHSNDTRVVVARSGRDILPAAYGLDIGQVWKPSANLWINSALWYLFLDQEFVYVGDAGIVEPSGETRRMGIEVGTRYQINTHLFFDTDANYTYARSVEEEEGANFIPLAPDLTAAGGLTFQNEKLSAGIRYRYIKDRPANEDNSIVAQGYLITDLNATYSFSKRFNVGFVVENLFDREWNEAQFATESQLQNEAFPVEELHFTPGTPFFIKASMRYNF